jgi:hypothetical protein
VLEKRWCDPGYIGSIIRPKMKWIQKDFNGLSEEV